MNFEQLFAGRMMLMRAQRHIAQAHVLRYTRAYKAWQPVFRGPEGRDAFNLVEHNLIELELEFTQRKQRCDRVKQRRLDRYADRQVEADYRRKA